MNNTRNEYDKRLKEVELYFETLELLDKGICSIRCVTIMGGEETKEIDIELSTILKANGFLLLYNLIEATVKNSIDAILDSIHSKTVTFGDLSENLKKIWLKQESNGFDPQKGPGKILLIAKAILENEMLTFKKDCINISGNIDAQEIRNILKQFGGNEIKNGRHLKTIKDKRNNLAHGEFTFSEIGKDYTIQELIQYKNEAKDFLLNVLSEVQDYIDNQKFLKIHS